MAVQRSGWSKQGGFEIYLRDGTRGAELWNIVKEAGKVHKIGNGGPTSPERTESGLVSCGSDSDDTTNPFEVRLGKFIDLDVEDDVVGIQALRRIHAQGPKRHQLGLILEGDDVDPLAFHWEDIFLDDKKVGDMTQCVWSPRLKKNIGYALISRNCSVGDRVTIKRSAGRRVLANLVELPFL